MEIGGEEEERESDMYIYIYRSRRVEEGGNDENGGPSLATFLKSSFGGRS